MYLIHFHGKNIIKMHFPKVEFFKFQTRFKHSLSKKIFFVALCSFLLKKCFFYVFFPFFIIDMFIKKIYYKVYLIMWNACSTIYNYLWHVTCGSILFTEADSINTYLSVSYLPLFSDSQSITLSHIMTHDIMINERKKKCFIKGIFLLVSFYLYPFTCI